MKFLLLCTLILSIAFLVTAAQPVAEEQAAPSQDAREHHHVLRSVVAPSIQGSAENEHLKDAGEVSCCG